MEQPVTSRSLSLDEAWCSSVLEYHARPAISISSNSHASFLEVDEFAIEIANDLRARGLTPGDAVVICGKRCSIWLPLILGIWKSGGVYVPCQGKSSEVIDSIAKHLDARFVIKLRDDSSWVDQVSIEEKSASGNVLLRTMPYHAYVMQTSGTTSTPKLVAITHQTASNVINGLSQIIGIERGDTALHTASFGFSSSIRQLFVPLFGGASIVIAKGSSTKLLVDDVIDLLQNQRIESLDFTPSLIRMILDYCDMSAIKFTNMAIKRLLVASEELTPMVLSRWRRVFELPHDIFHLYGQTESGGAVCAKQLSLSDEREKTLPLALPFDPFKANVKDLRKGVGELRVAGFNAGDKVFSLRQDYYAFTNSTEGRSLHTGDLFALSSSGELQYRGRKDNLVKILGVQVDILELQRSISNRTGIESVAAIFSTRLDGSPILCICVDRFNASGTSAQYNIRQSIASLIPELPFELLVIAEIPLNDSGKLDVPVINKIFKESQIKGVTKKQNCLTQLWIKHTGLDVWSNECNLDDNDIDFFQSGGDSLSMLSLLASVKERFGVLMSPAQFLENSTFSSFSSELKSAKCNPALLLSEATPTESSENTKKLSRAATQFQNDLWISEKLASGEHSKFWLTIEFLISRNLDERKIRNAMIRILSENSILCSRYEEHNHSELRIFPLFYPPGEFQISNINQISSSENSSLKKITNSDRLLRLALVQERSKARIRLSVHHAIVDRKSIVLILKDLARFYESEEFTTRNSSNRFSLGERPDSKVSLLAKKYWIDFKLPRRQLQGRFRNSTIFRTSSVVERIHSKHLPAKSSRLGYWLSRYHVAMSKLGLDCCNTIGIDFDCRSVTDRNAIGPYVNTLPIDLTGEEGNPRNAEFATAKIAEVLEFCAVPLKEVYTVPRDAVYDPYQPFFFFKMVYQKEAYPILKFDGEIAEYTALPQGLPENDITLFVRDSESNTALELAWNSDIINEHCAQTLLQEIATKELPV